MKAASAAPGCGQGGDVVGADAAGRVEGQLVPAGSCVERLAQQADERHVLVAVAARDGFEVEVDTVGAAVRDRLGDLAGQRLARVRAAQEGLRGRDLAARPGEALHRQHHARPLGVGVVDDVGQRAARPAGPADVLGAVGALSDEVAILVGADAEVGDGGQDAVVEARRRVGQLPVGQEAEDLAAQATAADRRGQDPIRHPRLRAVDGRCRAGWAARARSMEQARHRRAAMTRPRSALPRARREAVTSVRVRRPSSRRPVGA